MFILLLFFENRPKLHGSSHFFCFFRVFQNNRFPEVDLFAIHKILYSYSLFLFCEPNKKQPKRRFFDSDTKKKFEQLKTNLEKSFHSFIIISVDNTITHQNKSLIYIFSKFLFPYLLFAHFFVLFDISLQQHKSKTFLLLNKKHR